MTDATEKGHMEAPYGLPDILPDYYMGEEGDDHLFDYLDIKSRRQKQAMVGGAVKAHLKKGYQGNLSSLGLNEKLHWFFCHHLSRLVTYDAYIENIKEENDTEKSGHLYPAFEFIALNEITRGYWRHEITEEEVDRILINPPLKIEFDRKLEKIIPNIRYYIADAYHILEKTIPDIEGFDECADDKKQRIVNVIFSVASLGNDVRAIHEAIKLSPSIEAYFSHLLEAYAANITSQAPDTEIPQKDKDIVGIWGQSIEQLKTLIEHLQTDNLSQSTLDELLGIAEKLKATREFLPASENIDAKAMLGKLVSRLVSLRIKTDDLFDEKLILQLLAFWEHETGLLSNAVLDSVTSSDVERAIQDVDRLAGEYNKIRFELITLNDTLNEVDLALTNKSTPPKARKLNAKRRDLQNKIAKLQDVKIDKHEEILAAASPRNLPFDYDNNYIEKLHQKYASDTSHDTTGMMKVVANLISEYLNAPATDTEPDKTQTTESTQAEKVQVGDDVLQVEKPVDDTISIETTKTSEAIPATNESDVEEVNVVIESPAITPSVEVEPEPVPDYAKVNTPAIDIAQAYIGTDDQHNRHPVHQENLLWSMIDHGYTLIAYWFLKSLENACTVDPVLPSASLFKTAAIAPYVINIHGAAASLHTQSIKSIDTNHHLRVLANSRGCAVQCVSIAATLQPCMFNPFPVTAQILRSSAGKFNSDFSKLLMEIAEVADRGQSFTLDDFNKSQVTHDIDASLVTIQQEIEDIRKHVSSKKSGYYWANIITKDVIFESDLEPIVAIISKNKSDKTSISMVRDKVVRYSTQESLLKLLENKRHQLQSRKNSSEKIIGSARNYFLTQCSDLIDLATRWLDIQRQQNKQHQGYSAEKINHIIERLSTVLPKTIKSIEEKRNKADQLDEHAGLGILHTALNQIQKLVEGNQIKRFKDMNPEAWINLPVLMMGSPVDKEDTPLLADELANFALNDYDYLKWAQNAISEGNIKLANEVCNEIERLNVFDPKNIEKLREQIIEANNTQRDRINVHWYEIDRRTEQASNAGLLKQSDYTDCKLKLLDIQDDIEAGEIECLNYAEYENKLNKIDAIIQDVTIERLDELEKEWKKLRKVAERNTRLDDLPDGWEEGLREAINHSDVTVAEEYIQQFRDFLENNAELFDYRNKGQTALNKFLAKQQAIYDYFMKSGLREAAKAARDNKVIGDIDFNNVKEKPTKVLQALDSLGSPSRKKLNEGDVQNLGEILSFVGFQWPPAKRLKELYSKAGSKILMVKIPLKVGENDSPIPSFGSMHEEYYPVVLVWKYRNLEEIGQFLQQHQCTTGTIVLFINPLRPEERTQFAVFCHKERHTLMVLDPVVLLFLSSFRSLDRSETVLCSAFKVCLPFTYDNPYVNALYPPPPEMVFGRRQEIDRVMRPNGVAILYGGRQLGKSTILKEAESRLHRPSEDSYAFYFSVDSDIGKDLSYDALSKQLWNKIANKLSTYDLFKVERFKTAEEISNALRELMSRDKNLRITILLDEADNLLNIDSLHDFALFRGFREHFYDSNNRFRVVIAGLQNVQRFSNMPNNPLNQLGGSQPVKILPSTDAICLIRNPLVVLGFTFKEMTSVYRILAYTNNHAGLIQLFCHYLLEYLNNQVKNGRITMPGYEITERDIEQTYQSKDIREGIVYRFQLTLRLDPRYRVLAYGFILDNIKLNYFNVKEAKDIGDAYWPEEFRSMSMTKLRAILEEMVGLGVLIHETGDQNEDLYRFRNTNVFQLLGSEDVKRETIKEITEYHNEADPMLHHRCLKIGNKNKSTSKIYSPLTLGDELELLGKLDARQTDEEKKDQMPKADRPMITIASIYGSNATGLKHVKETLPWLSTLENPDAMTEFRLMFIDKIKAATLENVKTQVDKVLELASEKPIILTIDMPVFHDDVALYTEYLDYLYSMRRKKPEYPLWIMLLYDPAATWFWLNNRDADEVESDGIHIILQRWKDPGLTRLLNDQNMLDGPQQIKFLNEKTGGWYEFIKLFSDKASQAKRTDDPEKLGAFTKIIDERMTKERQVQHALDDIGITSVSSVEDLLKVLIKESFASEIQLDTINNLFVEEEEYKNWGFAGKGKQLLEWLVRMGIVRAITTADGQQYGSTDMCYEIEPLTQKLLGVIAQKDK